MLTSLRQQHCWAFTTLHQCLPWVQRASPLCPGVESLTGRRHVAACVSQDRPLKGADPVLWYSFGVTHLPRLEDFPVSGMGAGWVLMLRSGRHRAVHCTRPACCNDACFLLSLLVLVCIVLVSGQ
jgi:hypothetical protein